jgi:hypothetical protein
MRVKAFKFLLIYKSYIDHEIYYISCVTDWKKKDSSRIFQISLICKSYIDHEMCDLVLGLKKRKIKRKIKDNYELSSLWTKNYTLIESPLLLLMMIYSHFWIFLHNILTI